MIDPRQMTDGQEFRVRNERGVFIFKGIDSDGSVKCYGGPMGRGSWRNFRPENITAILKKKPPRD